MIKSMIILGQATVEKIAVANLTVKLNPSKTFTALLGDAWGVGSTPQEALANLECALIEAEQKETK